jgi:hypothetical protein
MNSGVALIQKCMQRKLQGIIGHDATEIVDQQCVYCQKLVKAQELCAIARPIIGGHAQCVLAAYDEESLVFNPNVKDWNEPQNARFILRCDRIRQGNRVVRFLSRVQTLDDICNKMGLHLWRRAAPKTFTSASTPYATTLVCGLCNEAIARGKHYGVEASGERKRQGHIDCFSEEKVGVCVETHPEVPNANANPFLLYGGRMGTFGRTDASKPNKSQPPKSEDGLNLADSIRYLQTMASGIYGVPKELLQPDTGPASDEKINRDWQLLVAFHTEIGDLATELGIVIPSMPYREGAERELLITAIRGAAKMYEGGEIFQVLQCVSDDPPQPPTAFLHFTPRLVGPVVMPVNAVPHNHSNDHEHPEIWANLSLYREQWARLRAEKYELYRRKTREFPRCEKHEGTYRMLDGSTRHVTLRVHHTPSNNRRLQYLWFECPGAPVYRDDSKPRQFA